MVTRTSKKSRENFNNVAINQLNFLLYSRVEDVFSKSGLADFFTKIEPVQIALAKKIEELIPKESIRIKELGAGADLTRWEIILGFDSKRKWQVILTDFSDNSIPDISLLAPGKNFTFTTEQYNLLDPLPPLKRKDKVDVILTTYVFDSIWFPQDAHLEKVDNKWYRAKYKITVDNNYSRKKLLSEALKIGYSPKALQTKDFQYICIEKGLDEVNIDVLQYGKVISKYYAHKSKVSLNFPGGLIKKLSEAFENQISSGGVFIIGDMAVNNPAGFIPKDSPNDKNIYMKDYATSGKAAKFKVEDYGIAQIILESVGFKVEVETVEDFIAKSGYEIPLRVKDHLIMIVKR